MNRPFARRLPVFSLRELLLLVTFLAVGCAALTFANDVWWMVVSSGAALACLTAAVIAAIDRGERQAFAIGFIICAGLYYGLVIGASRPGTNGTRYPELDTSNARYPTSKLLTWWFDEVVEITWIDANTGKVIPNYQPSSFPSTGASMRGGFVFANQTPNAGLFMRIGHALWTLLLGYVGGRFGRFVYVRRVAHKDFPQDPT